MKTKKKTAKKIGKTTPAPAAAAPPAPQPASAPRRPIHEIRNDLGRARSFAHLMNERALEQILQLVTALKLSPYEVSGIIDECDEDPARQGLAGALVIHTWSLRVADALDEAIVALYEHDQTPVPFR